MRQILEALTVIALATAIVPSFGNLATKTCNSAQACDVFNNTSTGSGVEGETSKGIGVRGIAAGGIGIRGYATTGTGVSGGATKGSGVTGFSSSGSGMSGSSTNGAGVSGMSASGTFTAAGVLGASSKHTGHDSAATFGYGNSPAYGMLGYGTNYGAYGETESAGTQTSVGYGVAGFDLSKSASSSSNAALLGYSASGTGLLAEAGGTPTQGTFGRGVPIGVYAVADGAGGSSGNAIALEADSDRYPIVALNTNDPYNYYYTQIASDGLFLNGSSNNGSFLLDNSGNLTISGSLYTGNGGPYIRTRGASGAAAIAYGERSTAPAIEDVGEAQLSLGRSFVRIDTALADAIDRRGTYHVFLTPEGDCNGLFVTQKSSTGFVVRELHGGHSTLAFEYRIVAKPFDENGARLAPAPEIQKPRRLLPPLSRRHMAVPLSPEQQAWHTGSLR